jgi:hypothetical protein
MKGDRLRVPLEDDYAFALGRAIFIFAKLEWSAVNCCERMKPNSIHSLTRQKKTAGGVAKILKKLADELPRSSLQTELCAAAVEFKKLAQRRNDLLHVQPASTADGAQRLFRDGVSWEVGKIDDAADDFTECNDRLVALWNKVPAAP